ncbi:TPA: response regulator transcription factor [Enterococcus faecalis]
MKLLIVDDEKKIVDYLVNILDWSEYGFSEVISFTSSKEAILRLEKGYIPDLLITDIKMPEVCGIDLVQKVEGKTKSIIISGYSDFEYAQQAIHYGVVDYLLKPIFPDVLEKAIERITKEIPIHKIIGNIDKKVFYLALLSDRLSDDDVLERTFEKLIKTYYFPSSASYGDKVLFEFSFLENTFGFVNKKKNQIKSKKSYQKEFFEEIFKVSITHSTIKDEWIKNEIDEKNWKNFILTLENPQFKKWDSENILIKIRAIYYLNKENPKIFKNKSIGDILELVIDNNLSNFLYTNLEHQIKELEDTNHSILFVQDYIKSNLSTSLSLEHLAEQVHIHPVYLSKIYKQSTGENLSQFILNQRLNKMKELLLNTDLKIKTITEFVGYRKPQNINELFKKKFGYTPSQYRKLNKRL